MKICLGFGLRKSGRQQQALLIMPTAIISSNTPPEEIEIDIRIKSKHYRFDNGDVAILFRDGLLKKKPNSTDFRPSMSPTTVSIYGTAISRSPRTFRQNASIGTINGLRLGRDETVTTAEINSALGEVVHLMVILRKTVLSYCQKPDTTLPGTLVPRGNQSSCIVVS